MNGIKQSGLYISKILAAICILCGLVLSGCDDEKHDENTIVMLTSADNPPFMFFSTGGDEKQIVGFEMDLMQEVAKLMNKKLVVKDMDFNGIIPAIQAKRGDLAIAAFSVTEERLKNVDFSHPYYDVSTILIEPQETEFLGQHDYHGQKIGVLFGSVQEAQAKQMEAQKEGLTVISMNRYPDLFQELQNGRIQAILIEETTGFAFLKNHHHHHWKIERANFAGSSYAMIFPKGSKLVIPVNEAIETLRKNGTLNTLKNKWFTDHLPS